MNLIESVQEADIVECLRKLKSGADPNIQDRRFGRTPLHWAPYVLCRDGCEYHRALLDHCADPNITDKNGRTPLHIAVQCKREDAVKLLLASGADVNIPASKEKEGGRTALCYAISSTRNIIRMLLAAGADPNPDVEITPVVAIQSKQDPGLFELLLHQGANWHDGLVRLRAVSEYRQPRIAVRSFEPHMLEHYSLELFAMDAAGCIL